MKNSVAYTLIADEGLTYNQKLRALARLGEETDDSLKYSEEYYEAKEKGILCDLNEGPMPYRPRYICPNYQLLIDEGSKFLDLEKANDLSEALNSLMIMYQHVPSITTFPVYLGNLDDLLEPFVVKESEESAKKQLKLFLRYIDKTLTDSFVHANIGPKATITGRLLMELTAEMQLAIPNLTLKYDPEITDEAFALLAIDCMLKTAKPSFANHKMFTKEWGDYTIASCYNGLKLAGGGFTLPRIKLYEASLEAKDADDFINRVIDKYAKLQFEYMDKRLRFIVEDSSFFKSNYLVTEGFVKLDNFVGMFGLVGLAECVNHLMGIKDPKKGFGFNDDALELGLKIMDKFQKLVDEHEAPYGLNKRYGLHAQVGIDTDGMEDSPGTRIPVMIEPEILDQLSVNEKFHRYFPTGTGDIFRFENTFLRTPDAILDIIKGSFKRGLRYFSGYLADNDVVRVTGYLVKKSEIEKLRQKRQSLNNVTVFGKGADEKAHALERRVQKQDASR